MWLHDFGFRGGSVTRAFDEWRVEHGYLLAYERVGIQFTSEGYDRLWEELGSQPSDAEGPELPDLFDEAVGNLALWQFEQIHLAAALRDAVTVFEMYLEAALVEVLETQLGRGLELPEKSPYWDDLKAAWKGLSGSISDGGESSQSEAAATGSRISVASSALVPNVPSTTYMSSGGPTRRFGSRGRRSRRT